MSFNVGSSSAVSNAVAVPISQALPTREIVALLNAKKSNEAAQLVQQMPREQRTLFLSEYPMNNPQTESFVQALVEKKQIDAVMQIVMKMTSDKTFLCFKNIMRTCSTSVFEELVEQFFQNDVFVQKKEARVVLALLFRTGRFDLGAKYFHALEALGSKPRWMVEYDGPDEDENCCYRSTWNTTLFVDVCECLEVNAQFKTDGTAIALALSKVINPLDEGDKFFPMKSDMCGERVRPAFSPLRHAIKNKWTAMIQIFSQFSQNPKREEPNNLENPYLDSRNLQTVFEYMRKVLGVQTTAQFYTGLDLRNTTTLEFLLDLIQSNNNSRDALQLCERIEAAHPDWWNNVTKANCFRFALDANNKKVADWFIDKIPNDYETLEGMWEYVCSAEVMGVEDEMVDIGNAVMFGHKDILTKLCQKKITLFLAQTQSAQQKKVQESILNIIDIVPDMWSAAKGENEKFCEDLLPIHQTIAKTTLTWATTYNYIWAALHTKNPHLALKALNQELKKSEPAAWVKDEKRIKQIRDFCVEHKYQEIVTLLGRS